MNKRDQRLASLALAMLLAGCASINPLAEKSRITMMPGRASRWKCRQI